MAKGKSNKSKSGYRVTRQQRILQIVFLVISAILILSMALSLAINL
jgi:hypothetical protein